MAVLLILIALVIGTCGPGAPDDGQASGGPLLPAQAAYDVTYYELDLAVEPSRRRIDGSLRVVAEVVEPLDSLVLDLDERMVVERVVSGDSDRPFRHDDGRLWIALAGQADAGESVDVTVYYGGEPREAPDAPWSGGFTWAQTSSGVPWIATSNQTEGADLWWPVKDHPSDEPDSMTIRITVPEPLEVASNGRLRNITAVGDSARKYDWFVSTPINSYAVALNIAPYDTVATAFTSTGGEDVPVTFWVLPEHVDEARAHLPEFVDHVRFLEALLGPYPFRADKYGIAHTPFLGMEHQTIIAYGNAFGNDAVFGYDQGFDALHFHELAHEWYGNLVTVRDWKDFWIHEGFASYLEALYAEELHGSEGYRAVIDHQYGRIQNRTPIAYHEPRTSKEVYGGDVYMKGSNVLHTLRYLIGDAAFFESIRCMAYPTDAHRTATAGTQTRHVDTDDFVAIAEAASGRELEWFFDTYLYHAELPRLVTEQRDGTVTLEWETPADATFEVPLPVRVGSDTVQVEMTGGRGTLDVGGSEFEIDPWRWVLRAR